MVEKFNDLLTKMENFDKIDFGNIEKFNGAKNIKLNYEPIFNEKSDYKKIDEVSLSKEEKEIYENANLEKSEVNGRECYQRTDLNYDEIDSNGFTNKERMERGMAPLKDGKPIELHHIGQKMDSPLAELTVQEHRGQGNDTILHDKKIDSQIDRREFKKEKENYWKARAAQI
ncbi:HNH/ENDO VII family nuclease [Cetobacterium sp.]|uniref:HNH/ENDO VII family nuclease n=1 Tax=Cetobacterium sp. TaxID=2071632 RepID=UPI003EE81F62